MCSASRLLRPLAWGALLAANACRPGGADAAPGLPRVMANDNRLAAGTRRGDTLALHLEVRMGRWFPEADDGLHVDAPVFAEVGKPPQVPGPLVRIPTGTIVAVTVRNTLPDSTLHLHGFVTRPAASDDSLLIAPGATRTLTFAAGAAGTYLYWATAGTVNLDVREREQLAGAFVVDSTGATANDRVLVMNIWGEPVDSTHYSNALTINGRSWPWTERIAATVGDTVRWRVVNASQRTHPMHLHGFFFRVDAKGNAFGDTSLAGDARRLVVTEHMDEHQTMEVSWLPVRPGNWVFHCHIGFHVLPEAARLETAPDTTATLSHMAERHMAGLVLGIQVRPPPGGATPTPSAVRALRLFVQEGPRRGRAKRSMGYVLAADDGTARRDSVVIPGPPLVLVRGQPTDVTVINHLQQPTSVHWHGLELESWSDGVSGWSGMGARTAPMIAPGDSFTAHLSLERAGTFIYHTHLGDFEQITSGLYGPIIVVEPGRAFEPATDHVFTVGWDGPTDPPHLLVNGDSTPADLVLAAGRTHRLRFINIGVAADVHFQLRRDSSLVQWRRVAKDGAEWPASRVHADSSQLSLDVGETSDVEFRPPRPGVYTLKMQVAPKLPGVTQRLVVR